MNDKENQSCVVKVLLPEVLVFLTCPGSMTKMMILLLVSLKSSFNESLCGSSFYMVKRPVQCSLSVVEA